MRVKIIITIKHKTHELGKYFSKSEIDREKFLFFLDNYFLKILKKMQISFNTHQ